MTTAFASVLELLRIPRGNPITSVIPVLQRIDILVGYSVTGQCSLSPLPSLSSSVFSSIPPVFFLHSLSSFHHDFILEVRECEVIEHYLSDVLLVWIYAPLPPPILTVRKRNHPVRGRLLTIS